MRTVRKGLTFLRALGVLYGVACGDALGAPFEFWNSATIQLNRPFEVGDPRHMEGRCTDDTGMTLALARGLLSGGTKRLEDCVGREFIRWYEGNPRGVGFACSTAIRNASARLSSGYLSSYPDLEPIWAWREAANIAEVLAGRPTDGNGALMRCSFCGLYAKSMNQARSLAARQADMTHTGQMQRKACTWYAATIWALSRSADPWLEWERRRKRLPREFEPVVWPSNPGGTAVSTMQAVVNMLDAARKLDLERPCAWATSDRKLVRDIMEATVLLGGDTDTVAALVGGLLGAIYGVDAFPRGWRHALEWPIRSGILQVTQELFKD